MAEDGSERGGISRRGFFKGVGVGAAAAGFINAPAEEAAAQEAAPSKLLGPGEVEATLKINGEERTLSVEPRTTLLDALRNRLDLTGSKKVCDRGTCGACTVLVDGEPAYACSMLALEAEGREITTIEGIGAPDSLTKVQEAIIEHDGSQCGFCTPGFVVAVTSFLDKHPGATRDEIRAGLGGNLCRCGTYAGLIDAAAAVAKGEA